MTTENDIGIGADWVERRAKLFEAGDYPDKGIAVSDDDLAALVEGFSAPVPVLIEHADSPLQLGFLTAVERAGRELHGTVSLSAEADALVRRSGARGLSLGLSPDLRTIREVSLVRHPRVAGAGFFSAAECVVFSGEILSDLSPRPPLRDEPLGEGELRPHPTLPQGGGIPSETLSKLVREGRMVPAQVPFAEALLACDGAVEFSGDRRPLRELLLALLERQPPLALFGQTAPASPGIDRPATMLPEEAAFYTRHFPGVPLTAIAEAKR